MYAKPCCGDRGTGKILYAKTGAVSEYADRKRWLCGAVGRFGQADGYGASKCESSKGKTLGAGSGVRIICGGFTGSGAGRADSDSY